MGDPITFIKVFVCDYIEEIEDAVNEYAKDHRCVPLSASVSCLNGCVSATVVFERGYGDE